MPQFSPTLNKPIVIHFIRPDKILEAEAVEDKQEKEEMSVRTKLTKAGRGDGELRWRIVYRSFLLQRPSVCVYLCVRFLLCVWVGDDWSDG